MAFSSTDNPANIKYAVFKLVPYEDFDQILEFAMKNHLLVCCDFYIILDDNAQKKLNHSQQGFFAELLQMTQAMFWIVNAHANS